MLEVTKDLVAHVAKLGMLKIDENDLANFQEHLIKVLKNIEELESVATEGVAPFVNPMAERLDLFIEHDDPGQDEIRPSMAVTDVLSNAPEHKLNQFRVEAAIGDAK